MKKLIIIFGLLLAGAGALFLTSSERPAGRTGPVETVTAEEILETVREARGAVVLLNFWASWCAPCRQEIPSLNRLHEEFSDDDLVILAVSVDQDKGALETFLAVTPMQYDVLFAAPDVAPRFSVGAIPRMVVYDPAGEMVLSEEGYMDHARLQRIVNDLLGGRP